MRRPRLRYRVLGTLYDTGYCVPCAGYRVRNAGYVVPGTGAEGTRRVMTNDARGAAPAERRSAATTTNIRHNSKHQPTNTDEDGNVTLVVIATPGK